MAGISKKVLLSDIVASEKPDQVPSHYIRPISERPNLQEVNVHDSIPLIDLQDLNGPNRPHVVEQIGRACRDYGFFQVMNHGVPESTISNVMHVAKEFFNLPEEERLKLYSDDLNIKATGLYSNYNKEVRKHADWRDFMGLLCHPIQDFINEWPTNPASFRDHAAEYSRSIRELALQLNEAISESLGLEKDYINRQMGKYAQHLVLNYYPPCPQPDLTYGLPGHTDFYIIGILLQGEVPGLQVFKDGQWVAVEPVPNRFIVNICDQIQVISNDKYKSVLHRAVVNTDTERISIPSFLVPSDEAVMGPAPELVTDNEPAVYKQFTYGEYFEEYKKKDPTKTNCLHLFMAT